MASSREHGAQSTTPKRDSGWSALAENSSPLRTKSNYDANIVSSLTDQYNDSDRDRTYLLKVWQGRERLRIRVDELEALVERCYHCVRALKQENQELREEAEAHQAAYLESQDTLEHLLRNVEIYIKNPAEYHRIRMNSNTGTDCQHLVKEWKEASWISFGDSEDTLKGVLQMIEQNQLVEAGAKIDNILRSGALNPFVEIDLHLMKTVVMRGLNCATVALKNADESIRICDQLRKEDKLNTDNEINYLAKTKWFKAKCSIPQGKTADLSAALQSAYVVRGEANEVATWRNIVATEGRKYGEEAWNLDDDVDSLQQLGHGEDDKAVSVPRAPGTHGPSKLSLLFGFVTNPQKAIPSQTRRSPSPTKLLPMNVSRGGRSRKNSFSSFFSSGSAAPTTLSDDEIAKGSEDFDIDFANLSTPTSSSDSKSTRVEYSIPFWNVDHCHSGYASPFMVA